mgnify:CR=1 FL=1
MTKQRNILVFMGTRPEAVKLAPVVAALREADDFRCTVVATGQHKEMFRQVADTFGFASAEGASSFFVFSPGAGRIEVMKGPEWRKPHIAVRVANFERAVDILKAKGVELEAPKIAGGVKTVYLKNPDPAGNRVHLFWRR